MWRNFTPASVQTAIFTPQHSEFVASRAVATILREFGKKFDGEMQVLPLPEPVPPEVPRIQLQSSDGEWRVDIGPARFGSWWTVVKTESPRSLSETIEACSDVQQRYVRRHQVQVGRVGLVVQRVCPVDNPAQLLIDRFCNAPSRKEPFNRSASFEIHNHKEYTPNHGGVDYLINSWVRCKSAKLATSNAAVILVEHDLNSVAGELASRRFDADQIHGFFKVAAFEADEILRKYFPE